MRAMSSIVTLIGFCLPWISVISRLVFKSGFGIWIILSKRPGLVTALSRMSILFVAAIIRTFPEESNPSIKTSSWFNVVSRSPLDPSSPPARFLPTASNSSINMTAGWFSVANLNISRSLDDPTPIYFSLNSDPAHRIKFAFTSPAKHFAISVFPFPGGPSNKTPRGILTLYFV